MYYGSGTVDRIASGQQARQMLLNAAADAACSLTRSQHFSAWNLETMTSYQKSDSVNRCVFTSRTIRYQQFCRISSRSDIKCQSLRLLLKRVAPTRTTSKSTTPGRRRRVAIWHQFLVQKLLWR